ncbi:DUF1471 domain-containing protein [Serratia sp. T13T92]|jgi:hypothetical protein|uniref:DUF1471 domain-containing protein n=1 Tax=Serratia sp. T13T92 TaxID=3397496 RepID=UPI0039E19122
MKSFKKIAIVSVLSLSCFSGFAKTISASALTLDEAETKISKIAKKNNASYKIIGTFYGNYVHITAKLIK